MLDVRNVDKSYGAIDVLRDVTFSVDEGAAFAVIGPNGAGKTTLFKVLTGEAFADRGEIVYRADSVARLPAWRRIGAGIGRTFQTSRVFPAFTVEQNIVVALEARGRSSGEGRPSWLRIAPSRGVVEEAARWAGEVGLSHRLLEEARFLSHGDKKRLELAMALSLRPKLIMLDEPTAGMSPVERSRSVALIARIRREFGLTLLLTEHDMDVVFDLADHILVLNYGQVIFRGPPAEIRGNAAVRDIYLGQDDDA
ncbi:MAG: hypothetical protein BGP06_20300 [Rhizobiales bacterium 65-9]|nr:ABC transporter ATP-binding protein [Hyphomicrobiales bacterium]OJY39773.1 MAG: hypothetical protein BGP06_20300 [Rhizobiales bacterium 65-9]